MGFKHFCWQSLSCRLSNLHHWKWKTSHTVYKADKQAVCGVPCAAYYIDCFCGYFRQLAANFLTSNCRLRSWIELNMNHVFYSCGRLKSFLVLFSRPSTCFVMFIFLRSAGKEEIRHPAPTCCHPSILLGDRAAWLWFGCHARMHLLSSQ